MTNIKLSRSQSADNFLKVVDNQDNIIEKFEIISTDLLLPELEEPKAYYYLTETEMNNVMDDIQMEFFNVGMEKERIERGLINHCLTCRKYCVFSLCPACYQWCFRELPIDYHKMF